jgi:hypothetical protein
MGLMQFISIPALITSFALGVLLVYITSPAPREIMVYPTPENVKKVLYKDRADQCFEFKHTEIPCPKDKNQIKEVPVQDHSEDEN